jgi:dienelactone hydrolase
MRLSLPTKLHFIVLLAAFLFNPATGFCSADLDPQLNERVLRIPVDTKPNISLETTIFKPSGPGPFPIAVLNHGLDAGGPHSMPRYRSAYLARYFVSRGYEVVMPMLRGFSGSDGDYISIGCDAEGEGFRQAKDIKAVIEYLSRQPDVDAGQIIIGGQSYGGWNALAVGALNLPGVKGQVNFSGGRVTPFCPTMDSDLALGAGHFGALTHTPSLWFYGENDSRFPTPVWQEMFRKFRSDGGQAELVDYGHFMNDAHNFLGYAEALSTWVPKLDSFLERVGLPHQNVHPEVFPTLYPSETHFSAIADVNAVPFLDEKGREQYRRYLNLEMPRVFVISPDGTAVVSQAGYDPLGRALAICKANGRVCRPYAIDDTVVWQ